KTFKAKHHEASAILVEDKANGPAIIDTLKREISGIIPVEPNGDKVQRLEAASPQIEAGNVYLPENAEFTKDYIEEMVAFPNAKHDDRVDATSQLLNWVERKPVAYASSQNIWSGDFDMERDWKKYNKSSILKLHGDVYMYRDLYKGRHAKYSPIAARLIEDGEVIDFLEGGRETAVNVRTPYIIANISKVICDVPKLLISGSMKDIVTNHKDVVLEEIGEEKSIE